ncbi:RCC1 domain-containing protein [Sorangium sp. So ce394]
MWCWGSNTWRQLGDTTCITRPTARPVVGVADVEGIALGRDHTCAMASDHRAIRWEANDHGAIGDSSAPAERSLEARVGRLEREVQALLERRSASMRDELRCPACGARKILHAPKVLDADADGRSELAIAKPSVWSSRRVGKLEAYICASASARVVKPCKVARDGRLHRPLRRRDEPAWCRQYPDQIVETGQHGQLALRGECGLGLVQEVDPVAAEAVRHQGQERLVIPERSTEPPRSGRLMMLARRGVGALL